MMSAELVVMFVVLVATRPERVNMFPIAVARLLLVVARLPERVRR